VSTSSAPDTKPARSRLTLVLLGVIVAVGFWLRWSSAVASALWVDEAESSINALTILEHGLPTNQYLGIPIFENTLIRKWPGHPEYEFRDISYSDRGLATYHQWLPLYAMAASFRLFGITPDRFAGEFLPRQGADEMRLRTIAARAPALVFALLTIVLVWLAANATCGPRAAWPAALLAAITPSMISYGSQARYYSATIAFSTLSVYALWRMLAHARTRDFVLGAFSLVLLFYTHLLTFAAGCATAAALTLYLFLTRPDIRMRTVLFWSAIAAACVPWVFLSGFPDTWGAAPSGWSFFSFPAGLVAPLLEKSRIVYGAVIVIGCVLVLGARRLPLPAQTAAAFAESRPAVWLLGGWIAFGYLGSLLLMPAASQFADRLTLSFIGPAIVLIAIVIGLVVRLANVAAPAICSLLLLLVASAGDLQIAVSKTAETGFGEVEAVARYFGRYPPEPASRLYAAPNQHLVLTFYTGWPVQSIAPVRKEFLDRYPGPVILLDREEHIVWSGYTIPMLREFQIFGWNEWRRRFVFRFSYSDYPKDEWVNCRDRFAGVTAQHLPGSWWLVYRSEGRAMTSAAMQAHASAGLRP